ncbi:Uncharacterised protein [Bordetella pertussis]|nr:Uncharacterised protein [Bordetella pertussis]
MPPLASLEPCPMAAWSIPPMAPWSMAAPCCPAAPWSMPGMSCAMPMSIIVSTCTGSSAGTSACMPSRGASVARA